jgi:MFS family permease
MEEFENYKKGLKFDDFGDVFNDSIEIYKKTALLSGVGFIIISTIIGICLGIGIKFYGNLDNIEQTMQNLRPETLSIQGRLILIAVITGVTILINPFIAGILKMNKDASDGNEVKLSTIFSYVNSKYFIQIILFTITLSISTQGINQIFTILLGQQIGGLMGTIASLSISTLSFITMPFIIFSDQNFIDAIKNSITKISNCFFTVFLLLIVSYILAFIGFIAFCIGIFFTMPFIYAVQYTIYKRLS